MNEEQKKWLENVKQMCIAALDGMATYEDTIERIDDAIAHSPEP